MRCLSGIKFNMLATVLNLGDIVPAIPEAVDAAIPGGHFETIQDEDTGALTRIWVEDVAPAPRPNQGNRTLEQTVYERFDLPCYARGFTELGFRSTANTQSFDDGVYRAIEVIQMNYPSSYHLNRSQLVTNIRGLNNNILWLEEETGQPTVFDVQGVTPIFDAFNRHMENIAVLKRTVNQ